MHARRSSTWIAPLGTLAAGLVVGLVLGGALGPSAPDSALAPAAAPGSSPEGRSALVPAGIAPLPEEHFAANDEEAAWILMQIYVEGNHPDQVPARGTAGGGPRLLREGARARSRGRGVAREPGAPALGERRSDAALRRPGASVGVAGALWSGRFTVAVGTALADRPPRRSQREGLPHWAPALGSDAQALTRIGVADSRGGQPAFRQAAHPRPSNVALLATSAECAPPAAKHLQPKLRERR